MNTIVKLFPDACQLQLFLQIKILRQISIFQKIFSTLECHVLNFIGQLAERNVPNDRKRLPKRSHSLAKQNDLYKRLVSQA